MKTEKIKITDITKLPNIFSIIRIIGGPVVLFLMKDVSTEGKLLCLIVAMLFMSTDFFDGYISHRLNKVTNLGTLLDPLADKVFSLFCLLGMFYYRDLPIWAVSLIISRDIIIGLGSSLILIKERMILSSRRWGKWYTTLLFLSISSYIIFPGKGISYFLMTLTFALLIISLISYIRVFVYVMLGKEVPPDKSE